MLNIIDEFTHECLAIRINRKLKAIDVIDVSPTSLSCVACQATSAPTTALSSRLRPCKLDRGRGNQDRLHRARQPVENGFIQSFQCAPE